MSHGSSTALENTINQTQLLFVHWSPRSWRAAIGLYEDNGHGGGEDDWPIGPKGDGMIEAVNQLGAFENLHLIRHRWTITPIDMLTSFVCFYIK